ncbi:hypothetical protein [Pseudonocardia sp. TRM90224]|uniref:hypothetical protein n=1 Tax=Pseudonocardia sp. TRM90224 TaxID=2812678 RepID=UPI001E44777D|nr:hypothetical protein [Pseudonocardia sp. TRM90224]
MSAWLIGLLAVIGGLLLAAIVVLVARRLLRTQRVESGWDAWTRVAATLPWRDRIAILRSNSTGLPVQDVRLAALAAQRGEAAQSYLAATAGWTVWVWRAVAAVQLVSAVLHVLDQDWLFAALYLGLAIFWLCMPYLIRFDRRLVARSAEANARLAPDEL